MNSHWIAHALAQKMTEATKLLKIGRSFSTNRIDFKIVRQRSEMMHQQQVSRSGSAVTERAVSTRRQRSYRLLSCWRRTFWAHAVIEIMWCDTCDLLRDNNCYSCLLLFSQLFISRRMHCAVWIHCCKRPNCDFWISQGSVATVLRWGGETKIVYVRLFLDFVCQQLLKLANVSRSYSKNKSGTVFWDPVYKSMPRMWDCSCAMRRFLKWDDAPCDLNSVGGIRALCELDMRWRHRSTT